MSTLLFDIARFASRDLYFKPIAAELGFSLPGDIDRFIFSIYGKVVREIPPADRLRGTIFVLEPSAATDGLGTVATLKPIYQEIQVNSSQAFYSLRLDLVGEPVMAYQCTSQDRKALVDGGWPLQVAQQYSRIHKKCVVWAMGVGVHVYINGDIYLESIDVVEELAIGVPGGFQNLSWSDGKIMYEFARHKLNDASAGGVWQVPEKYVLRPKPEVLIRSRLGEFLRFRLAGYRHHDEEPHVENEGRADISLHLIDGRIFIVEIKWLGCSLVSARLGATELAIKNAVSKNSKGWLTKFKENTIPSGIRQLVSYYRTGKYIKAYLTVFDCAETAPESCEVKVTATDLDSHNPANFRVLRARVDPRSASKRARR